MVNKATTGQLKKSSETITGVVEAANRITTPVNEPPTTTRACPGLPPPFAVGPVPCPPLKYSKPLGRRGPPTAVVTLPPRRPPQMGQPRRRGYPHGRHHRCPRGIALPAAGAGLLFLSVSLLSVSLLSAPPLADPRPGLGTSSSSRRFLRRHPVWTDPNSSPASLVRASRSHSLSVSLFITLYEPADKRL
jgi:hypothetical protein